MSSRSIPSDEDFVRARAAMQERDRGLSEVRSTILNLFGPDGLHQFFILYSEPHNLFGAYLFFTTQSALVAAEHSGLTDAIKSSVADQLERVGRGEKAALNIRFEVDTDENVQNEYDGDYYARLR